MSLVLAAALAVLGLLGGGDARVLTRCGLARVLVWYGTPRDLVPDFVCLAEAESSLDTAKVATTDGSARNGYGIFQINDTEWCSSSGINRCNVRCEELLADDIRQSLACANLIYSDALRYSESGFEPWLGWKESCRGQDLTKFMDDQTTGKACLY
ncbi:lysozyme-like [Ixodes scapularis]